MQPLPINLHNIYLAHDVVCLIFVRQSTSLRNSHRTSWWATLMTIGSSVGRCAKINSGVLRPTQGRSTRDAILGTSRVVKNGATVNLQCLLKQSCILPMGLRRSTSSRHTDRLRRSTSSRDRLLPLTGPLRKRRLIYNAVIVLSGDFCMWRNTTGSCDISKRRSTSGTWRRRTSGFRHRCERNNPRELPFHIGACAFEPCISRLVAA